MKRRTFFLHSTVALCAVTFIILGSVLVTFWNDLPDIKNPDILLAKQSLVIVDREGNELYRFYDEQDRTVIPYKKIPQHLVDAIVAIEDKRFFTRQCIDLRAISRALVANIKEPKSQGASTITQQLARTALLTRTKTLERKIKEMMLACQLEWEYSKEEILSMYLNWIPFGHGIAGVEQASKRYFGKNAEDITLPEAAILAALPQRPSYFSPYGSHVRTTVSDSARRLIRKEKIRELSEEDVILGLIGTLTKLKGAPILLPGRSNLVLKAMHEQRKISSEERRLADIHLTEFAFKPLPLPIRAPHFVITLEQELSQILESSPHLQKEKGLRVVTTLDPALQTLAEETLTSHMKTIDSTYGASNAALLAVDPRSNEIRAYVGNRNFYDNDHSGQVDMIRIPRQTGSAFKPFVYAALFENKGYTSRHYIYDKPLDPKIYRAHASGYYGKMQIRHALARSRNVPAIRAFYLAGGEEEVLRTASKIGIRTPLSYKEAVIRTKPRFRFGWPLALGSAESSLLEMIQGYSVLARHGNRSAVTGVARIENTDGKTVYEPAMRNEQVLSSHTTNELTNILSDHDAREPLWKYAMTVPEKAAIKTGTSNICKERNYYGACKTILPNNAWTIGYTPNLLAGVWIGNADNTPLTEEGVAVHTSTPLWKDFFSSALLDTRLSYRSSSLAIK